MSNWLEKFAKIADYKMSLSPIREVDDVDIYMDGQGYHEFCNEFKTFGVNPDTNPYHSLNIDSLWCHGVKFLIHKIDNI